MYHKNLYCMSEIKTPVLYMLQCFLQQKEDNTCIALVGMREMLEITFLMW